MNRRFLDRALKQFCSAIALSLVTGLAYTSTPVAAAEKSKVFFSMGFVGNNWMTEARNMITALADSKEYRDRVDFETQSAGGNTQQQIQQISAMVQAGAKAVIVYPLNEPALRQVFERGCKAGVDFYVLNGASDTCEHAFVAQGYSIGHARMDWMTKTLNGKGNIVVLTGIPGTAFSDETQQGVNDVLKQNPGIKVIATLNGEWSQQVTRVRMQELLASKSWDDIDGVVAAEACYTIIQMQLEAGRSPDKLKPCAAQDENGFRLAMLPKDSVSGAMGVQGMSTDSMIWAVPYALQMAVDKMDGKPVPKVFKMEAGTVDNKNVKYCETGSQSELKAGCNVFPAKLVPNDWQAGFYSPDLPRLDLTAVTTGKPVQ